MENKTMGQVISALRKEKGMTQKELADKLNITDKAVSKWERDLSCPDTALIPRLAEIFGVSLEELMNAKPAQTPGHRGAEYILDIVLPAVPMAMGIAVTVTAALGELEAMDGLSMLGIGLACAGLHLLRRRKK